MHENTRIDEDIHDDQLPVLIIPNWTFEFHMYIDASNFALGAMLSQNTNNIINHPIYYASVNDWSQENYMAIEKETLVMIYVVRKFWHYLLGNNFFFIDH
jgi:hypothetical protein